MPVFNYPDYYVNSIRNAVCSNPIATSAAAANCAASNSAPTFPRIRNNSAYAMDIDEVRNTLEGMARNTVFVTQNRWYRHIMSHAANYRRSLFGKMQEDHRRMELGYIKILLSSKATIRYRIEVK